MRWSQTSSNLSGLSELPIISHPCSAFKISGGSNNSKLVCPEFTSLGGVLKHDDRCHPCEPFQPKSDICDLSPADSPAQCLLRSVPFGSSSCQASGSISDISTNSNSNIHFTRHKGNTTSRSNDGVAWTSAPSATRGCGVIAEDCLPSVVQPPRCGDGYERL